MTAENAVAAYDVPARVVAFVEEMIHEGTPVDAVLSATMAAAIQIAKDHDASADFYVAVEMFSNDLRALRRRKEVARLMAMACAENPEASATAVAVSVCHGFYDGRKVVVGDEADEAAMTAHYPDVVRALVLVRAEGIAAEQIATVQMVIDPDGGESHMFTMYDERDDRICQINFCKQHGHHFLSLSDLRKQEAGHAPGFSHVLH